MIQAGCSLTLASERDVASRLLVSMLRSTVEIPHRVEGVQRFLAQLRNALPRGAQHPPKNRFEGAHVVLRRRCSLRVASIDSPMALRCSESDLAALSEDSATACMPLAPSSPDAFSSLIHLGGQLGLFLVELPRADRPVVVQPAQRRPDVLDIDRGLRC
ncbi:hypothetical protein P4110_00010 [Pseudomonas aeruginosa]|nr:hypothetical protein [Pseudomonas aeruginosa]